MQTVRILTTLRRKCCFIKCNSYQTKWKMLFHLCASMGIENNNNLVITLMKHICLLVAGGGKQRVSVFKKPVWKFQVEY